MKAFIIRDCLVRGEIFERPVVSAEVFGIARTPSGVGYAYGEWKASREDALAAAEQIRADRLAWLIEEIKKLESLEFKVL